MSGPSASTVNALAGAQRSLDREGSEAIGAVDLSADFRALFDASPMPFLVVAPPDWTIVAANDARLKVTGMTRAEQIGRRLFDVFPDDPNDPTADGVRNLSASLQRVLATKASDVMAVQRYAVREPDGRFTERWWSPLNSPVLDGRGEVALVIHRVEDVTELMRLRGQAEAHDQLMRDQQGVIDRLRASEASSREADVRRQALIDLSDALRDLTVPADVAYAAAGILGRVLNASRVGYAAIDHDAETLHVDADWTAPGVEPLAGTLRLRDYGSFIEDMKRGDLIVTNDARVDPRTTGPYADALAARSAVAFVNAPILEQGRLVAAFFVNAARARIWTDGELALIKEFASRTRVAVERARADVALRASETRHRFRVRLDDALRGLSTPSAIMAAVADLLGPHLGVDQSNYYRIEGDRFIVTEEWRSDASAGMIGAHALAAFGQSVPTRMAAGEMLRFDDTREAEGAEAYAAVGMAAVLSAPLRSGGRWAGGFHVHCVAPRAWTDDEATLMRETAERAWAAVEQARAEAALRESEARYRTLFENIDAAFCVVEVIFDDQGRPVDHRFVEINPAFEQQSGLKDALGRTAREILPDHEQHWFDIYGEIVRTGEPARFENGSEALGRWFDVHALRVGSPDQRRVAILFNDITDRKRAEDRLRELNETLETRVAEQVAERNLLATLVETTDVMIMAADRDYNILAINKANADEFERIYGIRPKVGDNMLGLLADRPEHQAQVRAGWGRGLAGEESTFVEDYGEPDRTRPYYEIKFRTLRDEAGEIVGTYQFVTDVTARLREQAQLAEAQEALRQSQKMEAMGSLTGGVAHDFNNLLTPIIGSLDMLVRKGVGSERERRLIDGALQSAERAKTLVQRLLAFARRQPLQPVAVDIGRLVEGMAGLIGSTLGPTIDVRLDLAPDLPSARADLNQLEMALLNLTVNARDAMPDGGELTITARRESVRDRHRAGVAPGHYVLLRVTDSGVGMDEATLAKAVEPFFSTKGIGKGTGLGLSMVHGLAAQLGGGMTIDSVPGRGTSIELWLPISAVAVGDDEVAAPAPQARVGRGTALLVDDEDLVRMSTADMLVDLGFEVVEAGSAEEALKLMNEGATPDLLVTDHLMPGMNGADLALEARALSPRLPVLIVSGYAEVEGIAPELPRLVKPFRNAELAASLAALLPARDR